MSASTKQPEQIDGFKVWVSCPTCKAKVDLHSTAWLGDGGLQYCFDHVVRKGQLLHSEGWRSGRLRYGYPPEAQDKIRTEAAK